MAETRGTGANHEKVDGFEKCKGCPIHFSPCCSLRPHASALAGVFQSLYIVNDGLTGGFQIVPIERGDLGLPFRHPRVARYQ